MKNNYIKSFKSEDGKNIIFALIPTASANGFLKTHVEKNLNNLFNRIKKGGENIIYRRIPELTTTRINGLYLPFEFVELHLPIYTENNLKGLSAPGDVYIITDTRQKPRKELDDTAAFKKFDVKKLDKEALEECCELLSIYYLCDVRNNISNRYEQGMVGTK